MKRIASKRDRFAPDLNVPVSRTFYMSRAAALSFGKLLHGIESLSWPDDAAAKVSDGHGGARFKTWDEVMVDRRKRQAEELRNKRRSYEKESRWVRLWAAFNPHWCYHGWFLCLNEMGSTENQGIRGVNDSMRAALGISQMDDDEWIQEFAVKFSRKIDFNGYPRGSVLLKVCGDGNQLNEILAIHPHEKRECKWQQDWGFIV